MKRPVGFLAVILFVFFSSLLCAEEASTPLLQMTGTLEGRLLTEGGKPVSWAILTLSPVDSSGTKREPISLLTGSDGTFVAGSLEPGTYRIVVSHIAYEPPAPLFVEIRRGACAQLKVTLKERLFEGPSIVVVGNRVPPRAHPLEKTIAGEKLREQPGVLEDPLRVLARKPGVETRSDVDGRLSFRGGSPQEAGYALDGIPLPSSYHLGGLTSIFHPAAIEKVMFYPGGHPVSLGPGTAGFVEVESRRRSWEGESRRFELSPITLGGLWMRTSEDQRWSGYASARRTYHDLVLSALHADDGFAVPNFFDLQMRAIWQRRPNERCELQALRSGDRVHMSLAGLTHGGSGNELQLSGDLGRFAFTWDREWGQGETKSSGVRITLAHQPYEYDFRVSGDDEESMDWDANAWILSGKGFWKIGGHHLGAGYMEIRQRLRYLISIARGFWQAWSGGGTEGSLSGDPVTLSGSGFRQAGSRAWFIEDDWRPGGGRWHLTGGVRGEVFSASSERCVTPRLAVRYRFGSTELRGAWGLYAGHPLDRPGDPTSIGGDIRIRRASHLVVGFQRELGRAGCLSVDVYDRRAKGLISETSPGIYESVGRGHGYGLEVEWGRKANAWEVDLAYTHGRSLRRDPQGPLVRSVSPLPSGGYQISWTHGEEGWYPGPFDPGHRVRIDARWKLTPRVKLSASWSFHSGAPVTPITGIARDGEGNAYGIEGAPGSARLPAYHRLDARIQRTNQTSWGRWSVYLEVANLYNRANVFQSAYNESYTGRNEYRMLPLLPTLGVSVEF